MPRSLYPVTLALSALLVGACASVEKASVTSAPDPAQAVEPEAGSDTDAPTAPAAAQGAEPAAVGAALERALDEGWEELHILNECNTGAGFDSIEIFGNGVAILNRKAQFSLTPDQIRQHLQAFVDVDFGRFDEKYGGKKPAEEKTEWPKAIPQAPPDSGASSGPAVMEIACRIQLELDGFSKQVAQERMGDQSEPLRQLASRIFEICREPARAGIEAASLEDGLSKLAAGKLAPETLELVFHRKPRKSAEAEGVLLRINGRRASTRTFRAAEGYGDVWTLELPPAELTKISQALIAHSPEELPINLYAEHYTDLKIRVLDREKGIQARQFAGLTPTEHGEKQQRFDQMIGALSALHRQILAKGQPQS